MSSSRFDRLRRPHFRGIRTPVATPRQSAIRLAVVGVGSVVVLIPLWYLTTQTRAGQELADQILYGRVLAAPAVLGAARDALATVSLAMAVIAALGLGILAFLRGGVGLLVVVALLIAGANVTTQLLQEQLTRPNLLGDLAFAFGNSFPSGHVALVGSLGLAAVLVVPRALRTPTAILAAIAIAIVSTSTIAAGWHRLADAVGAMLIDLAWASLLTALLVAAQGWMPRRTWRRGHGGGATGLATMLGVAAVLAGGLGLALVVVGPGPVAEWLSVGPAPARTFVAGVTISAGSAFLVVAAFVWALRGVALELQPPLP
jgi:membrane-associated phospholipid phosphatase